MSASANSVWTPSVENQNEIQNALHSDAGIGYCYLEISTQNLTLDLVARRHYGLSEDEPVNTSLVLECIHPEDRAKFENMFWNARKIEGEKLRHRVPLEDGSCRYLEMFLRVDSANYFHGILLDVSEAMNTQETLAEERRRFEDIAAGVPGQFCFIDKEYHMRFLSNDIRDRLNAAQGTFVEGNSDGGLIENTWDARISMFDFLTDEMSEARKPMVDRALSGEAMVWEDEWTDENGAKICEQVTYQPKRDPDGSVAGIFALRLDITDMRRMEAELREAHENLLRSNTDLEQFAYVASHDLKAPLRAIQVLIEWLEEDLTDYDEGDVQENIGLLGKRAARLSALLDDLLAYSRAARQNEPSTEIDLKDLVEEVSDLIGQTENGSVKWQGSDIPKMHTDHAALHQVVRNLIGNAIKHHSGTDCQVLVSAAVRDDLIEVAIEDNGEGIDPEFSEKIFQMFQTLKPRDDVEGSGMGLAIVKRLVNHHGGEIWFEKPQSGIGTTFKFTWQRNADKTLNEH